MEIISCTYSTYIYTHTSTQIILHACMHAWMDGCRWVEVHCPQSLYWRDSERRSCDSSSLPAPPQELLMRAFGCRSLHAIISEANPYFLACQPRDLMRTRSSWPLRAVSFLHFGELKPYTLSLSLSLSRPLHTYTYVCVAIFICLFLCL